ncbi:peptide-methionine (R)-S-oxide reductase [Jannaschia seohaensis]|nr:peptide-methionine (R)-S-oxide reductase [Jannaschia seohaensis]
MTTGTNVATGLRAEQVRAPSGRLIAKYIPEESDYPYEVRRSKVEWMDLLDGDAKAYGILRKAHTEWPKTTELWREAHEPGYLCRGCNLPMYEAGWFQPLDKGWVFFHHAKPNAVMLALDGPVREYGRSMRVSGDRLALTEVHCRRCGSHLGHHLPVEGVHLHCINGTSLKLA